VPAALAVEQFRSKREVTISILVDHVVVVDAWLAEAICK
jgi:hypothetical protein